MGEYNFKNVTVSLQTKRYGSVVLKGWSEGDDVISAERDEDDIVPHVGALSETHVSIVGNPTGTITLKLQAQASHNSILSSLSKNKEKFGISIVEKNTQELIIGGTECYVVKTSTRTRGRAMGENSWVIKVLDYEVNE